MGLQPTDFRRFGVGFFRVADLAFFMAFEIGKNNTRPGLVVAPGNVFSTVECFHPIDWAKIPKVRSSICHHLSKPPDERATKSIDAFSEMRD